MFALKYQDTAPWSIKALTLARATVPNAFDALRESAKAAFARQASRHTPATPSDATPTRFDASTFNTTPTTGTPHPSGTAIVASVGVACAPLTYPFHNHLILNPFNNKGAVPSTSHAVPPFNDIHAPFDLTIDERPQSDASAHSSRRFASQSSSTSPTTLGCQQNNKVDVGVQVSFPFPELSPHSSSSSDFDPPIECLTPLTTNGECHSHPKAETLEPLLPFNAPFPSDVGNVAREAEGYIPELNKSTAHIQDLHEDVPAERAITHRYIQHADTDEDDTSAKPSISTRATSSTGSVASTSSNSSLEFSDTESFDGELSDADGEWDSDDTANHYDEEFSVPPVDTDRPKPRRIIALHNPHTGSRYLVNGVIAHGGFAYVLDATDLTGEPVAIKVTHTKRAYRRPGARQMLMDEMDIMAWVTKQSRRGLNLGLMGLVESWEDENNVYFVMGLHRGSLRQYMELQCDLALDGADRQKKFELKHVKHHADRFYMAQSIFSLWHLHGAGVVHRDIKPDNLLLDKYGRCTLADFGLVMRASVPGKVSFENVMSSRECGTEEYFAPEQRRALPYNYKVDIWALGCVWVELLAGLDEPWTQHGSFPEKHIVYYRTKGAREGVRESVVELIGEDHPALELVLWMTQPDPANRPSTDEIIDHEFFSDIEWDKLFGDPNYAQYEAWFLPEYKELSNSLTARLSIAHGLQTDSVSGTGRSQEDPHASSYCVEQTEMRVADPNVLAWSSFHLRVRR